MYAAMPGHEEALATSAPDRRVGRGELQEPQPRQAAVPLVQAARREDARGLPPRAVRGRGCASGSARIPPQVAVDRMEHELGIINRMGFASYFLIVWDFVRYAREQGIPNSARGSACGALVSYLLYLSHVDPLKYDLLFERFLDPNRSEAPDIDIDLCKDRRVEVIAYVREKYGADERRPDRDLRHDGREGVDQGRRPGAEHPARPGRPGHQADPDPAQHHARRGARRGAAAQEADRRRPRTQEALRLRQAARRDGPERRDPRGGRRDRRPSALRPRPAPEDPQQGQGEGGRQHPVGDGGRREGRPAQDGLPRAPEPHQPRRRRPPDQLAAIPTTRSTSTRSRSTTRRPMPCSSGARPRGCSSSTARASATSSSR